MEDPKNTLTVTIKNPEGTTYEGPALSITSLNRNGTFDILPYHENFITMIQKNVTVVLPSGEKKEISLENGILKVTANSVEVYLAVTSLSK